MPKSFQVKRRSALNILHVTKGKNLEAATNEQLLLWKDHFDVDSDFRSTEACMSTWQLAASLQSDWYNASCNRKLRYGFSIYGNRDFSVIWRPKK